MQTLPVFHRYTSPLKREPWWVRTPLWPSSFKETKCFSPLTLKLSILWWASVTERWRARPQTARCLEGSVTLFISPFARGYSGPV